MTTATATISHPATMFLLPSHHHHHHHHGLVETPVPSLTPPPQSLEEAAAEVEAEVEQFRRQLYLRRGLSYPGPKTTISLPRQGTTVVARQQYSSDGFSGKMVGLSPVVTATVITGTTTASTAGAVGLKTESSPSSSSSSPSSSSITTTSTPISSGGSGDNNTRLPKTFSQLMEDLIRTHSSTASPSGQKYSRDLLQGTIGHYKDAVFAGGTYFGSFT